MARRGSRHEIGLSHVTSALSKQTAQRYGGCFGQHRTSLPGERMRSLTLALVVTLSTATAAGGQGRYGQIDHTGLPRDVAREATRLFNESAALRSTGRVEIDEDRVVDGDVAVLNGPLLISGRVRGRVLAINSDVVLRPSARIDGVLRPGASFASKTDAIGHNVNSEIRLGRRGGLLLGGRLFNVVAPTETWQLTNLHARLAAFVAHRDYRDYYERRGGQVRAGL